MANYKPFKMKGHALPGINQQEGHPKVAAEGLAASSPAQWDWKNTLKKGWDKATQVGMGIKAFAAQNDQNVYGGISRKGSSPWEAGKKAYQKEKRHDEGGGGSATYHKAERTKTKYKKSPAKCPLIAAIPAITGAIGAVSSLAKKKEQ